MNFLINVFIGLKNKLELFKGWLEVVLKPEYNRYYKYIIQRIEIRREQGKLYSIIYYKLIGCRKLIFESSYDLNKLCLFTLFRPDHAQIIVSLATSEALMSYAKNEMEEKYKEYIASCNLKIGE